MTITLIIAAYFALSFVFSSMVGKAIAYGMGSDLENQ